MAVGQYVIYERALRELDPERSLWRAVPRAVKDGILEEAIGQLLLHDGAIRLLAFDAEAEEITEWIPSIATETSSSKS